MAGVTVAADSSPHNAQALCRYTPHHDEYVPPLVLLLYSWNRLPWLPVCVAEVGGKGLGLAPPPPGSKLPIALLYQRSDPHTALSGSIRSARVRCGHIRYLSMRCI